MVKIRSRKHKNSTSYYLDYSEFGERVREPLAIKTFPGDIAYDTKMKLLDQIRANKELNLILNRHKEVEYSFGDMIISDHADSYVESTDKAGQKKYKSALKYIRMFFQKKTYSKLDTYYCEEFLSFLYNQKGVSTVTANGYFSCFSQIVKDASKQRCISGNPCKLIDKKTPEKSRRKDILYPDEFQKLLNTKLVDCENGVKEAAVLSFYTGLGYAECKKLKKSQLVNGELRYHRCKNGNYASIPIDSRILKFVLDHNHDKREELVFPNLPGESWQRRLLLRWCERAGIHKHITFYCFRHSFAINSLIAGVADRTLADFMGHSTTKEISTYTRWLDRLRDRDKLKIPVVVPMKIA